MNLKKIPSEIKIGNRKITVEIRDYNEEELASFGDTMVYGYYSPSNFSIVIDANLKNSNPTQIVETFWHELIHAVNDSIRFSQELLKEMSDKDTIEEDAWKFEEQFTESFARTFLQVIQDNNLLSVSEK